MTLKWSKIGDEYSVKLGSINGYKYELVMKFICCSDNYKYKQISYYIYRDDLLIWKNTEVIPLTQSFNNHFTIGDITYNIRKVLKSEGIICTDVLRL